MLTFDHYQTTAASTAVYPDRGTGSRTALAYVCLGLGEVGEVQEKVADLNPDPSGNDRSEVAAELGDVLWYAAQLATELGTTLGKVAGGHTTCDGTIDNFQDQVRATEPVDDVVGAGLRLGVAGDVQGLVKKILRGDDAAQTPQYRDKVTARLGDLLAAAATFASALQVRLADVAQQNLDKLADRADRGVLKGAGDNR